VKISDAVKSWRSILLTNALDLFCVAAHYSERYESADNYLEQHSDDADLIRHALYFRGKTAEYIVGDFTSEFRVCNKTDLDANDKLPLIAMSTMEYMWRKYLKDRQYPSVLSIPVFLSTSKQILETYYDATRDGFVGITNPSIHTVDKFNRFWSQHISLDSLDPLLEYEIGELAALYREDTKDKRMTESQMLDLIRFYHEDIQIVDNKHVQGIYCSLWNKKQELCDFFSYIELVDQVSFYDAYTIYLSRKNRRVVSKAYFEKYICCEMPNFDSENGCILFTRSEQYKDSSQIDNIKTVAETNESECVDSVPISFP
jgi:hypothetical protein